MIVTYVILLIIIIFAVLALISAFVYWLDDLEMLDGIPKHHINKYKDKK